jgi:hypothetical protein
VGDGMVGPPALPGTIKRSRISSSPRGDGWVGHAGAQNRECLILSDKDQPALQAQKKYGGYGEWCTYPDIFTESVAITGEDFLKDTAVLNAIRNTLKNHSGLSGFGVGNFENGKGKIQSIGSWLGNKGIDKDDRRQILDEIKEFIFDNLRTTQIGDEYFDLLKRLAEKFNN